MNGSSLKPRWVDGFDSQDLSAAYAPARCCRESAVHGAAYLGDHPPGAERARIRPRRGSRRARGGSDIGTRLGTGRREVDDVGEVVHTRCVAAAVWIGVVGCASPCTRARPAGAWWRPVVSSCGPRPPRCRRPAREPAPKQMQQSCDVRADLARDGPPARGVMLCQGAPLAERGTGRILRGDARGVRPGDHRPSDLRDQGPLLLGSSALAPIRGSCL